MLRRLGSLAPRRATDETLSPVVVLIEAFGHSMSIEEASSIIDQLQDIIPRPMIKTQFRDGLRVIFSRLGRVVADHQIDTAAHDLCRLLGKATN
ncbi:MAG: hypothetical protein A2826_01365 [Candidatus Doudnabacteria bacterium RIFCSPHIGHO2_01_FULL_43_23]|uniref:Uncharacterized protein n=1 Tax=Candidatus Doudnabacteria bacterium RIFCSPHIGHO2_01_FULL_43_23 TaxID=1817822 RepID=A0A1F5NT86_9BACT|nr:MAG: hypothetical protein A2826_01365 [Candidatus Doudnabacteria bacterium RIFCSPHIGHO2_01_FULL_43_23]